MHAGLVDAYRRAQHAAPVGPTRFRDQRRPSLLNLRAVTKGQTATPRLRQIGDRGTPGARPIALGERADADRGRRSGDAVALGLARQSRPGRHQIRLRRRILRRLHGPRGRRRDAVLHAARREVAGRAIITIEGLAAAPALHPCNVPGPSWTSRNAATARPGRSRPPRRSSRARRIRPTSILRAA